MTDLQKQAADIIIDFYKSRNGTQYNRETVLAGIDQSKIPLSDSRYALNVLVYNKLLAPSMDGPNYLILSEKGWDYENYDKFEKERKELEQLERDQKQSVIDTNKSSRRSNFWSPIWAGLAAVIALTGLIREILKDSRQETKEQQSIQQMTQRDSLLRSQQTQIDSLLIITARRDTVPKKP